jgi:hypothetical protein
LEFNRRCILINILIIFLSGWLIAHSVGNQVIRQPVSAVSSLAFLLVGVYALTSMIHDYAAQRKVRTLTVNFDSDDEDKKFGGSGSREDVEQHVSLSYESVLAPDESLSPIVSFPFVSGMLILYFFLV